MERAAHAWSLACALRPIMKDREPEPSNPIIEIIELSSQIARALYGTKKDWVTLAMSDLTKIRRGDVEYKKKQDRANMPRTMY